MNVVKMQESDLDSITKLEEKCFLQPWNKEQCLYELNENPFSTGYIVEEEGDIKGYAFLWVTFEIAQLARIGVAPSSRKKGYGKFLMQALLEKSKEAGCEFFSLEVRESNEAARKMYESLGFIQVNVSKNYYPDGENAIVMSVAV